MRMTLNLCLGLAEGMAVVLQRDKRWTDPLRRICPGRHLASATVRSVFNQSSYLQVLTSFRQLWMMIVSTLATLNIARKKGDDLDVEYTNGLISYVYIQTLKSVRTKLTASDV